MGSGIPKGACNIRNTKVSEAISSESSAGSQWMAFGHLHGGRGFFPQDRGFLQREDFRQRRFATPNRTAALCAAMVFRPRRAL